ncbi:MAG TPA: response regulator transcription factor [Polyangiaceae bacterium]|nr:response regulator transcription factor [Polyangiaceae bacterium]
MRILVVDDNEELQDLVGRSLASDGNQTVGATTVSQAWHELESNRVDLMVLDLGLPDGTGIALCRRLREARNTLPILVLTANRAVAAHVECLDAGADDYLGKPFAVAELRARVRALARRAQPSERELLVIGDCRLDFRARSAVVAGRQAPVTTREWAILELLMTRRGSIVTREELLQSAWGRVDASARTSLDVLISRIRRKLGVGIVRTVRGEGYVLGDA